MTDPKPTPPAKKAPAKKASAKTAAPNPYTPTVDDTTGRLDHSTCTHPRSPRGRAACRAARAAAK